MDEDAAYCWNVAVAGMLGFASGFVHAVALCAILCISIHSYPDGLIGLSTGPYSVAAVALRAVCFPIYFLAVLSASYIAYGTAKADRRRSPNELSMLAFTFAVVASFLCVGLIAPAFATAGEAGAIAAAFIGAAAMGAQGATSRLIANRIASGPAGGSQLVQAALMMANADDQRRDPVDASIQRFKCGWTSIVHFAFGAACGLIFYSLFAFWALLVPLFVLVIIAAELALEKRPNWSMIVAD